MSESNGAVLTAIVSDHYDTHSEMVVLLESLCDPTNTLLGMTLELDEQDFASPVHRDLLSGIRSLVDAGLYSGLAGLGPLLRKIKRSHGESVADLFDYLEASRFLKPREAHEHEAMIRSLRTMRRRREAAARARAAGDSIAMLPSPMVQGEIENLADDLSAMALDLEPMNSMAQGADVARETFEAICQPPERVPKRIMSGITMIDDALGGFEPGQLVLIGARPSVGKTGLAKTIVLRALRDQFSCCFALAEGNRSTLMNGLFSQMTGIPLSRLVRFQTSQSERAKLAEVAGQFKSFRFEINDSARLSPKAIVARARRMKQTIGLDLLAVDYLQKLDLPKAETRERSVAEASFEFAQCASELGIVVLLLCQLNREISSREVKEPRLTDLRESGSLEQDADVVLLPHRPAALDPTLDPTIASIIIAKNRVGPVGSKEVAFVPHTASFVDCHR